MSEDPTPIDARHLAYLAERTLGDDAFLLELRAAARAAGLPAIAISAAQASWLQILVRASGAREVLEVGTLGGYSAIRLARALPPEGRVRTVELCAEHARFARAWVARSDVAGRVEVLEGAGADVLPGLAADSVDAAFLDADKASYGLYLDQCLRIVRSGGWIAVDNAFAFGQLFAAGAVGADVAAVRAFNQRMAAEERLQSVIVPLGDGCWVGVKLR